LWHVNKTSSYTVASARVFIYIVVKSGINLDIVSVAYDIFVISCISLLGGMVILFALFKYCLCTQRRHIRGVEIELHILTSALEAGELSGA